MFPMWRPGARKPVDEPTAGLQATSLIPTLVARAPMIVSILLGLILAAQAVSTARFLTTDLSVAGGGHAAMPTRTRAHAGSRLGAIVAAHLFGVAPREAAATNPGVAGRAPLVVTGIIATGDPHNGFAIVGSSAAKTHAVYAGSPVAPGMILAEVYPQRVILLRGRERLTLRLPRKPLSGAGGSGGPRPRERSASVASTGGGSGERASGGRAHATEEEKQQAWEYDRQHPLATRLTDSSAVVHAFALRPASVAGVRGMRIGNTAVNSKALAALGLAPGDVIVQVNGVPARSGPALMRALQQGGATLVVDRGGEETSVTLDRNTLADAASLYRKADPNL